MTTRSVIDRLTTPLVWVVLAMVNLVFACIRVGAGDWGRALVLLGNAVILLYVASLVAQLDALRRDPCSCGTPETYSLNPAEVVVHRSDGPCYIANAVPRPKGAA